MSFYQRFNGVSMEQNKNCFWSPQVGRPSLNPRTVFITSSAFGVPSVCSSACSALKDKAIGVSRGGKNTKVHVIINERMQFLKVMLTGGQVHDGEPAIALLSGIKLGGKKILEDKAYSSKHIRVFLAEHELYKHRNIVERLFQRVKNYRHISNTWLCQRFCVNSKPPRNANFCWVCERKNSW